MIRFVLGPDATVVPDIRRKLPGRGVWVSGETRAWRRRVKRQAFARGFKAKVAAAPDLAAESEALLARDCLQALSMANKAGVVVAGFAKVEAALAGGHGGGAPPRERGGRGRRAQARSGGTAAFRRPGQASRR